MLVKASCWVDVPLFFSEVANYYMYLTVKPFISDKTWIWGWQFADSIDFALICLVTGLNKKLRVLYYMYCTCSRNWNEPEVGVFVADQKESQLPARDKNVCILK